MRVTGGEFAGRKIAAPRSDARPTSDRVRESMFAILGDLSELAVLDLCAGSGALGFESLSRGADSVVAVDHTAAAIAVIRQNANTLGVVDRVKARRADAAAALTRMGRAGERFDLVLIDPPYAGGLAEELAQGTVRARILNPGAQVVVESDRRHPLADVDGLRQEDQRRYGDTLVTFYRADVPTQSEAEDSPTHE